MQKTLFVFLICCLGLVLTLAPAQAPARSAETTTTLSSGDVVKAEGSTTVYYIGHDLKRHVFPSGKIYKTWYDDYSGIKVIKTKSIQTIPLSRVSVTHKPGKKLVKITTDPKVYAVGPGGALHWIKTEALAKKIYGAAWNQKIEDLPDQLFTNYSLGDEIDEEADYDPEEQEEAVPEISYDLIEPDVTITEDIIVEPDTTASEESTESEAVEESAEPTEVISIFDGDYTITYDLSQIEVAVAGQKTTVSMSEIESGGVAVGAVDIPAAIGDKIDAELSHHINMDIAANRFLGVRKITMTNLDLNEQPSIDGLYTERNQNFIFGKFSALDPPSRNCGILGGKLIGGHFTNSGISNGKTTIGFIAGCKGLFLAARATVNWTATEGLMSTEDIYEISEEIQDTLIVIEIEEEEETTETEELLPCTETDGGRVTETKGTTSGKYGVVSGITTKTDYCNSYDGTLVEYFCSGTYGMQFNSITCPGVCEDGACVEAEEVECIVSSDCPSQMKCEDSTCVDVGCIAEGEYAPSAGINPESLDHLATECCSGLTSITYSEYYDDDCAWQPLAGAPTGVCANCGNGICEAYETKCNCPADCEEEAIVCTETDGGRVTETKGTTSGKYGVVSGITTKTDYCNSYDGTLVEYFCSSTSSMQFNSITCPGVCEDGACIEQNLEEEYPCLDPDGGKDYYEKGTVTERGLYTDFCEDNDYLREYFCSTSDITSHDPITEEPIIIHADSIRYGCPNGCADGACIEAEAIPCIDPDGIDLETKTTTTGKYGVVPGTSVMTDYCIGTGQIVEYHCIGDYMQFHSYDCPSGSSCSDGACI